MVAFEEEWVNFQSYYCEDRTLCNHSIASVVFGVNPLFLGGIQMLGNYIIARIQYEDKYFG